MIRIPDRVTEGYGPSVEAMRRVSRRRAPELVVTVDCGAVSFEPFAEAARLGLDVVVFDHHQAPETLPPALALVDPNRQDDLSGLGALCAAGVVFMALVDLNRRLRGDGRRPRPQGQARSRRAGDRGRRRSARRPQPRLRRARAGDDAAARAAGARRSARRRRRRRPADRPITSASCWVRASTPAAASATPRSAAGC